MRSHIFAAVSGALVVVLAAVAVGVGYSERGGLGEVTGIYMSKVTAEKQGSLKGGSVQKGREGWFNADSLDYEITSPRDAATGQATNKRQHKPVRVRRDITDASAQFAQALANNEVFPEIEFRVFRASSGADKSAAASVERECLIVKLTNASLASYHVLTEQTDRGPRLLEELEFVYQKMDITSGSKTTTIGWGSAGGMK